MESLVPTPGFSWRRDLNYWRMERRLSHQLEQEVSKNGLLKLILKVITQQMIFKKMEANRTKDNNYDQNFHLVKIELFLIPNILIKLNNPFSTLN